MQAVLRALQGDVPARLGRAGPGPPAAGRRPGIAAYGQRRSGTAGPHHVGPGESGGLAGWPGFRRWRKTSGRQAVKGAAGGQASGISRAGPHPNGGRAGVGGVGQEGERGTGLTGRAGARKGPGPGPRP